MSVYFLFEDNTPPVYPTEAFAPTLVSTATPFQPLATTAEIVESSTSTPTAQPTPTEVPIPFEVALSSGNPMKIEIKGSSVLERYSKQGILLKELAIVDCKGCTFQEINKTLGSATVPEWIAIRDYVGDTTILYVHSSWHIQHGPYFGEIFRRIAKEEDLEGKEVCFNEICFLIANVKILERKEITGAIPVSRFFEPQANQVILVTCDSYTIPGMQTPKMIIQMIPR